MGADIFELLLYHIVFIFNKIQKMLVIIKFEKFWPYWDARLADQVTYQLVLIYLVVSLWYLKIIINLLEE